MTMQKMFGKDIEKNIVALATLLQSKAIVGMDQGYCSCNATCSCEDKPGCCEGKCACHTDTDVTSPESLASNPEYREIVASFNAEQMKTIEQFELLVAQLRTSLANKGR